MTSPTLEMTILRHGVRPSSRNPFAGTTAGAGVTLTDFQADLLEHAAPIRIAAAPTGAGKTFAFELAPLIGLNILFVVPTRRLAQNLEAGVRETMGKNGWDEEKIARRLSVWTSDATAAKTADGMSPADIRKERVDQLRGNGDFAEEGTFIIATPESVASLLLAPPKPGSGQSAMSLIDLASRDHIVFDEFHTIEAQGFGLAAALCKLISGVCGEVAARRPRVTFLSATPIDILPALEGFDVPREEIACLSETVDSWRPGEEPEGARMVHGDIEFAAGTYADAIEACRHEGAAIARARSQEKAVIVILDSVAKLKARRAELARIFGEHGIPAEQILTIDSIDDAHASGADESGAWGRTRDPRDFSVILATSSIEMGVTFKAILMIMDPGHDACSFVQRIGRVSRGDLSGRVVVTRDGKASVIRSLAQRLRKSRPQLVESGGDIEIDAFIAEMLHGIRGGFVYADKAPELETYTQMAARAVWCAALFWCALRRSWAVRAGERDLLAEHAPKKSWAVEKRLRALEKSTLEAPKIWVRAFVREARRFRQIEPRVRVRHGGKTDEIAESLAGRYREIAKASVYEDATGPFLSLNKPLESILRGGDTRSYRPTIQPISPLDGLDIGTLPVEGAAEKWRVRVKNGANRFGAAGEEAREASRDLVAMTRIIPVDVEQDDIQGMGGSGVL